MSRRVTGRPRNSDSQSQQQSNSNSPPSTQGPPRKTEEELREEEELNLALALSQSEAEHKEKEKKRITRDAGRSFSPSPVHNRTPSPKADDVDPELARYLNRSYWEQKQGSITPDNASPSAPSQHHQKNVTINSPTDSPVNNSNMTTLHRNAVNVGITDDPEMNDFVSALKSQVEIFVNRMKSNSSRGRSIANDSSVQTLFMNITAMHSRLLRYIQQQDDDRLRFEGLQDKLSQVKDARAALDALREEHQDQLRREAEEAERQRQLQMAHKLEIMRKKKQEYLQYQRQLALQRIQEQEREMQMRQEQQKQQYLMGTGIVPGTPGSNVPPGSQYGYMSSPVHLPPGPGSQPQYGPPPPPAPYVAQPSNPQIGGYPIYGIPPHQGGGGPAIPMPMPPPSGGAPPPAMHRGGPPQPQPQPQPSGAQIQSNQQHQPQAPLPTPPPQQQTQPPVAATESEHNKTAELISFD